MLRHLLDSTESRGEQTTSEDEVCELSDGDGDGDSATRHTGKDAARPVLKRLACPRCKDFIEIKLLRKEEVQCDECQIWVSHNWQENYGEDYAEVKRLRLRHFKKQKQLEDEANGVLKPEKTAEQKAAHVKAVQASRARHPEKYKAQVAASNAKKAEIARIRNLEKTRNVMNCPVCDAVVPVTLAKNFVPLRILECPDETCKVYFSSKWPENHGVDRRDVELELKRMEARDERANRTEEQKEESRVKDQNKRKRAATEAGLEKKRERQRLKAQKKRDEIKANPDAYAAFKKKDNERRQQQRAEMKPVLKEEKNECARVDPFVSGSDTIAALAGHFAGDGCVRPESLRVISATSDVTDAFKRVFGGTCCRSARGYFTWCLSYGSAREAAQALLPYAFGKQEQIQEWLGSRCGTLIAAMKLVEPVIDPTVALREGVFDQIIGGFLGSDGNVHVRGIETYRPVVVFAQKHRQLLDLIKNHFTGGTEVVECSTSATRGGKKHSSFRLEYKNAAAMELIRRIEPYVTVGYKRSICHAILNMAPNKDLQKMVWGLQKASKDHLWQKRRQATASEANVDDEEDEFNEKNRSDDDNDDNDENENENNEN